MGQRQLAGAAAEHAAWVPPYWTEVAGGWQRVAGFWIGADAGELEYRATPPASLEVGPSSAAPADNYFYTPGTWNYYDTGYRWQAGYWSPYQPDWVWTPSRWSWTPSGCVFLPGFWDFRLSFRGQMFAPVYFRRPIYTQPGYCYRPTCVIDSNRLFVHLWIRPSCGSYYFGNYYGSGYSSWNLTPWCNSHSRRGYHDPLLTWCNTHYRQQGINYSGRVKGWHDHFESHADDRPPRTFHEQSRLVASHKFDPKTSQSVLGHKLGDRDWHDDHPLHVTRLDDKGQAAARSAAGDIRKLHTERSKIEHSHRVSRDHLQLPTAKQGGSGGPSLAAASVDADGKGDSKPVGGADQQVRHQSAKMQLPKLPDAVRQATTSIKSPPTGNSSPKSSASTLHKSPSRASQISRSPSFGGDGAGKPSGNPSVTSSPDSDSKPDSHIPRSQSGQSSRPSGFACASGREPDLQPRQDRR